jgi:hypothetical protein
MPTGISLIKKGGPIVTVFAVAAVLIWCPSYGDTSPVNWDIAIFLCSVPLTLAFFGIGQLMDRRSNTPKELTPRLVGDDEEPVLVNPAVVRCGFMLFPKEMARKLKPGHIHEALLTNKTELWTAVRFLQPSMPVHLISTNRDISPADAVIALNADRIYRRCSIALDPMSMSPDGGRTFVTVYVGFAWTTSPRELIVAGPQKILPGKIPRDIRFLLWLCAGIFAILLSLGVTGYLVEVQALAEKAWAFPCVLAPLLLYRMTVEGCRANARLKYSDSWKLKIKPESESTGASCTGILSLRCSKCAAVYRPGLDAVSVTSEELTEMMPGLVGTLPPGMMIGHSSKKEPEQLKRDCETILRLGPSLGWTCKECYHENSWNPIF